MHILFVSDDDLCRGPISCAIALQMAKKLGVTHTTFRSCGLSVVAPLRPDQELIHFMADKDFNLRKHFSTGFDLPLVRNSDLILCMTHDIRKQAMARVGSPQDGKIRVLNEAVGFGNTRQKQDIYTVEAYTEFQMMAVYSQLKATVGRLVRNLGDGDEVEDFGAKRVLAAERGVLDNPQVRQFLNHNIIEFITRSYEPPSSEQIAEHLQLVGQRVTAMEVEELCKSDLKNRLHRRADSTWELDAHAAEDDARARANQRAEQQAGPRTSNSSTKRPDPAELYSGKMNDETALEILSITMNTPRDEARKSIKKLLTRYHPDKFHDDEEFRLLAEEKTKQINQAWTLLEKRLPE